MPNGEDKNWIRLCAAIDGFKVRFGHWPEEVCLPQSVINGFDHADFKPESMSKIREKITLTGKDVPFVAQDAQGNQYCYGDEGFPKRRPKVDAKTWLAVEPDGPFQELEWEEM